METSIGLSNDIPIKLEPPYNAIIAGSTQSGKSHFVRQLLDHVNEVHTQPFERILYCYSMPENELFSVNVPGLQLLPTFPEFLFEETEPPVHTLVVLDDFMDRLAGDKRLISLFTKMRHRLVSTIFIVQNLYFCPKVGPCIRRNTDYYFLFENRGDQGMISSLGSRMFPGKKNYLPGAYRKALKNQYGYLFINLKPNIPQELVLSEGLLPYEQSYVYI